MSGRLRTFLLLVALLASAFAWATVPKLFAHGLISSPTSLSPNELPAEPTLALAPETSCPITLTKIMNSASGEVDKINNHIRSKGNTDLVTYDVLGDQLSNPQYESVPADLHQEQANTALQEEIWSYFASIIPSRQRELISEFSIITDGPQGTLAAVKQTDRNPELWAIEVDIADASDQANLTYALIHEFGHLLTLGPDQVEPSLALFDHPEDKDIYLDEVAACPSYFPGEGCSHSNSYINAFYNWFWGGIYAEWQKVNLNEDEDAYYEALDSFYVSFRDQFVTDYAATSPEEDIAESWSFFVLSPMPNGDTIAEQKILFFYEFPELVRLREQILNNLCRLHP